MYKIIIMGLFLYPFFSIGEGGDGGDVSLITTKAGVKAQRFGGVLFEANHSDIGGSSWCKIKKETGKKVCSRCSYKHYRRIDEKTGKVIYHYHKPNRHTASGSVQ